MSKQDKLIKKLLSKPKDFSWDELVRLLKGFDFELENKGKTSGSAVGFRNLKTNEKLFLHKPHPKKILKEYQIKKIVEDLKRRNLI